MISVTQILCFIASLITVFSSIAVVGRMTFHTDHLVRFAYSMVAIGSFGELASILAGHRPGLSETLVVIGLGVLCVADRRCSMFVDRPPLDKSNIPHHPV